MNLIKLYYNASSMDELQKIKREYPFNFDYTILLIRLIGEKNHVFACELMLCEIKPKINIGEGTCMNNINLLFKKLVQLVIANNDFERLLMLEKYVVAGALFEFLNENLYVEYINLFPQKFLLIPYDNMLTPYEKCAMNEHLKYDKMSLTYKKKYSDQDFIDAKPHWITRINNEVSHESIIFAFYLSFANNGYPARINSRLLEHLISHATHASVHPIADVICTELINGNKEILRQIKNLGAAYSPRGQSEVGWEIEGVMCSVLTNKEAAKIIFSMEKDDFMCVFKNYVDHYFWIYSLKPHLKDANPDIYKIILDGYLGKHLNENYYENKNDRTIDLIAELIKLFNAHGMQDLLDYTVERFQIKN